MSPWLIYLLVDVDSMMAIRRSPAFTLIGSQDLDVAWLHPERLLVWSAMTWLAEAILLMAQTCSFE